MLLIFLAGFFVGGGFGWFFWWTSRRENIRLDEQRQMLAQEKLIVFDFVHTMVEAMGEGINREELFERVVHSAILSTGALSACIFERKGDELRGVAVEGLFPPHRPLPEKSMARNTTRTKFLEQILKSEVFSIGEGLVGMAARTGKGILIENALEDPRVIKHDDPSLEMRSVIVVPITFREKNLGALAIVNPSDGGSFGETDFSLASSLAEQAGLAIHNLDLMASQIEKNKMDSDLSLAREIQSMLLPSQFPAVESLQMSTIYKPAQKVGGDLYDIFLIDENRIGVAIADVSGKGIPASLLMAICQSNLRHLARNYPSPARVLRELNGVLLGEMRPEMFITLVYAVIDLHAKKLTLARGGHELPIMIHGTESSENSGLNFLESEGMALGMVPDRIFETAIEDLTIPFTSGDILTLYTDGVTEVTNSEGVEFGNSRLAEIIRKQKASSCDEITSGILDRIDLFSGSGGQADDLTVVIIKHL